MPFHILLEGFLKLLADLTRGTCFVNDEYDPFLPGVFIDVYGSLGLLLRLAQQISVTVKGN